MATARELIRRSGQLIGIIGQGENLEASEANDGLAALNDMLETWSLMGAVFEETRESFALDGSVSYTIGSGGDFNTVRPIRITDAFIRSGSIDYPVNIEDKSSYAGVSLKSQSGRPCELYYDADYPLGNIFLNPVGDASYTLHLYSEKPLSGPAELDTTLSFPPGYIRGFRFNLACEWASEFGLPVPRKVQRIANQSLRAIKNANRMNDENKLRVDDALLGMGHKGYNIYRGS